MPKDGQLQSVQNITQVLERDAEKAFIEILQKKSAAEKQLVELIGYREEYENRVKADTATHGVSIEAVKRDRVFIDRLNETIFQQQALIHNLTKDLEARLEHWRKSHASNKSLEVLLQRYKQQKWQQNDRRMQAESEDTFNSRYNYDNK